MGSGFSVPTLPVSLLGSSVAVMLVFLSLGLLNLVFAMPSQEKELVNEMIDLVESGLDQSEARMGRFVMLSVTLSLTTENTETATVTTTLVNSCVAGTFTECTTSTEAASSRAASVEVVHSVKVPATQELTRVVVTVAVSVFSVVRERVTESMRTLPILASD